MEQPTKITSRNAKFGFCSLRREARKVAKRAMPAILMISIFLSSYPWNRKTDFILSNS